MMGYRGVVGCADGLPVAAPRPTTEGTEGALDTVHPGRTGSGAMDLRRTCGGPAYSDDVK